ncbi:thermonuclease family protein [Candidatus Aerophobetes bacterium]|nr:thermonuclease family protein [Candidatus Aerophobetes bacterium]
MEFLRDGFLILVVIITGTVILVMFIFHRFDIVLRIAPITSVQTEIESLSTHQPLPSPGPYRVSRVIDGDTIVLDNGERVRLIGVDAPETNHPEIPVQRFGEEATEFLRQFAEGFECTLEYEPGNIRDQYGRLLAYVFVGDRLANAELIRRGYAYAYTRFPFHRQADFIALEREARQHQSGLWDLSLRDGRIANLVKRYESLSMEGRKSLDDILEELVQQYPFEEMKNVDSLTGEGGK